MKGNELLLVGLLGVCSCDAPKRPEVLRYWETDSPVVVRVDPRLYERVGSANWEKIAAFWHGRAPALTFVSGSARVLREDAIPYIGLTLPRRSCGPLGGVKQSEACLVVGQSGVSQRFERKTPCGRAIVEADIAIDEGLLRDDSEALMQTIVHELGHLLGLRHPPKHQEQASVMFPDQRAAQRPTPSDLQLLNLIYSSRCSDD